jgi:hypothetical protein
LPGAARATDGELLLPNPMCQLDPRKRDGRGVECLEAEHQCASALYRAMILLDNVAQVFAHAHLASRALLTRHRKADNAALRPVLLKYSKRGAGKSTRALAIDIDVCLIYSGREGCKYLVGAV